MTGMQTSSTTTLTFLRGSEMHLNNVGCLTSMSRTSKTLARNFQDLLETTTPRFMENTSCTTRSSPLSQSIKAVRNIPVSTLLRIDCSGGATCSSFDIEASWVRDTNTWMRP